MSLDVYLYQPGSGKRQQAEAEIWIREDGQRRKIAREEWDERFPGREPVTLVAGGSTGEEGGFSDCFSANVTHNLNKMADAAGIYDALWRPDEIGIATAKQLVPLLRSGLERLRADPPRFEALNPENGWGSYKGFVPWVAAYLQACEEYPEATVRVSR
jgi:hypothetical protein